MPRARRRSAWLVLSVAVAGCPSVRPATRPTWMPSELEAQRRCEAGDAGACGKLGRSLLLADRDERDRERALVLLESGCGRSDWAACALLGEWYALQDDEGAQARARQLLGRACGARVDGACESLALMGTPEGRLAVESKSLRGGCARGDGAACERLGFIAKGRHDGAEEREAFGAGCRLGRASSCHVWGTLQMNEPATRAAGAELLARNCLGGQTVSCLPAASYFAPGVGDRPSCARVRPLAERTCRALGYDRSDACAMLDACRLEAGTDAAASLQRLRSSCDDGISLACFYWAEAQAGAGGPAPPPATPDELARAYQAACRGRSIAEGAACARLDLLELAAAQSSDATEGPLAHLRWSCAHGKGAACCALADVYVNGRWVPPDPASAANFRQVTCALPGQTCCATP